MFRGTTEPQSDCCCVRMLICSVRGDARRTERYKLLRAQLMGAKTRFFDDFALGKFIFYGVDKVEPLHSSVYYVGVVVNCRIGVV